MTDSDSVNPGKGVGCLVFAVLVVVFFFTALAISGGRVIDAIAVTLFAPIGLVLLRSLFWGASRF